ncbi:unnamed protein product [Dibothriocephalus latus]|uniref:EGF-like domain-containing protein n=1 Tax=Dibothriocephalus latus TaxID=60516 RepID=A0A3P6P8W6_DIBLA|nr:unnamed protein product [Dibothriocephalus latus]
MATQLPAESPLQLGEKNLLSALHVSKTQLGLCYPGGTFECIPAADNFTCACYDGFQGRYCEKRRDFCAEAGVSDRSPVKAGKFDSNNFLPHSADFWQCSGAALARTFNDFPFLFFALCLNGGVCRNRPFKTDPFECICQPGFSGPRCEQAVPACDSNPCMNGGRCEVIRNTDSLSGKPSNKLQCICPEGLGGASCECSVAGACLNGGQCIDGPGNFTCECADVLLLLSLLLLLLLIILLLLLLLLPLLLLLLLILLLLLLI